MESNELSIPLNGLAVGRNVFRRHVGKEFFDGFENKDILDASLDLEIVAEKSGRHLVVDCLVDGGVTVECDRCLSPLLLNVSPVIRLSVEYGDTPSDRLSDESGREVVCVSSGDADFDMSQIIYDYVCLSLPMQRVHDDGGCDRSVICRLSDSQSDNSCSDADSHGNNPFASLKDLLGN